MKPCFSKRKLIASLALGELDDRSAQDLRAHIQGCEGCRHYLEELSRVRETLETARETPGLQASDGFHRRWVKRLAPEPSVSLWHFVAGRLSWRAAWPALGAAAVIVALLLALNPRHPGAAPQLRAGPAAPGPAVIEQDLSPSVANYRRVAIRSLDGFDDLLTAQARRRVAPAPVYTASLFAAAQVRN